MGKRLGSFHRITKDKEEKSRKYQIGQGHIVNFVWGEKARRWLGVWGLADWMPCVSGQKEHL